MATGALLRPTARHEAVTAFTVRFGVAIGCGPCGLEWAGQESGRPLLILAAIRLVGLAYGFAMLAFVPWPSPTAWICLSARRSRYLPTTACCSSRTGSAI